MPLHHILLEDEKEGQIPLLHWIVRWAISEPQSEEKFQLAKYLLDQDIDVEARYKGETVLRGAVNYWVTQKAPIAAGMLALLDILIEKNALSYEPKGYYEFLRGIFKGQKPKHRNRFSFQK